MPRKKKNQQEEKAKKLEREKNKIHNKENKIKNNSSKKFQDIENSDIKKAEEEIQLDSESLEALTEQPEEEAEQFENFSEFMLSSGTEEMPTATLLPTIPAALPPSETPGETLEQAGEKAPAIPGMPGTATTAEPNTREDYTPIIYNEPGYTAGVSEEDMFESLKEMRETRRFLPRPEMAREMHPTIFMDESDELKEIREQQDRTTGGIRDYVVEVEKRDEKERLPFEKKPEREYKERR